MSSASTDPNDQVTETAKVLWGPYRSIENLSTDPSSPLHLTDLMVEVDQSIIGSPSVPRPDLRFSGCGDRAPAPMLGEDTNEALQRVLGHGEAKLADLRSRSVSGGPAR